WNSRWYSMYPLKIQRMGLKWIARHSMRSVFRQVPQLLKMQRYRLKSPPYELNTGGSMVKRASRAFLPNLDIPFRSGSRGPRSKSRHPPDHRNPSHPTRTTVKRLGFPAKGGRWNWPER